MFSKMIFYEIIQSALSDARDDCRIGFPVVRERRARDRFYRCGSGEARSARNGHARIDFPRWFRRRPCVRAWYSRPGTFSPGFPWIPPAVRDSLLVSLRVSVFAITRDDAGCHRRRYDVDSSFVPRCLVEALAIPDEDTSRSRPKARKGSSSLLSLLRLKI